MTTLSIAWLLMVGFGLGLKHAIEPDHLAAVSTIVSDRKNIWSASLIGGLWGVGHTISLFIAGILVILFHFQIKDPLAMILEFCVALMLIGLGIDALRKLAQGGQIHWHIHRHGGITHAHPHIHDKEKTHSLKAPAHARTHHGLKLSPRPLLVGMVHGLAGSGALMLLILSTIASPAIGAAYILVFGVGSIGGMILMSTLIGLPFHFTTIRFNHAEWLLRGAAGLFSLGFGLFMAYEIGFTQGLFRF